LVQHEPGLTVTHQPRSAHLHVLAVSGDLDHHTSPRLQAAVDDLALAPGDALVVDLSALAFCDSTGVSILVAAHQRAREAGAQAALAGLAPDIAHAFKIMSLDRLLSVHDTVEDAVTALD
jgi:anti-sigma B factor antagonist